MTDRFSIFVLASDLGQTAAAKLLANVGGQTRNIPLPANAPRSQLAREVGPEIAQWLADRFGGEKISFPSRLGQEREERAAMLAADVYDAGLTAPTRSANDIAAQHGVTATHVRRVRKQLRAADAGDAHPSVSGVSPDEDDLPLFKSFERAPRT